MNEPEENLLNEIVRILRMDRKARNNDGYLYLAYLKIKGYSELEFLSVFLNPREYNVATYPSVTRLRRKAQEEDRLSGRLEIQSSKQIKKARKELEKQYREYYIQTFNFSGNDTEAE